MSSFLLFEIIKVFALFKFKYFVKKITNRIFVDKKTKHKTAKALRQLNIFKYIHIYIHMYVYNT